MRNSKRGLIAILFFALYAVSVAWAEDGRASGRFVGENLEMRVTDAYAFYGKPSLGGKEKAIEVAVSNQGFVKAAMDEYWDRKKALEQEEIWQDPA